MAKGLVWQVTFCLLVFFPVKNIHGMEQSDCQGRWCRHQIFYQVDFHWESRRSGIANLVPMHHCTCSRTRDPFRHSGWLCWGFFHLHKLIYGSPPCTSALKRCSRACIFAISCRFARERVCAIFLWCSRVRICRGKCSGIFLGSNNAWECSRTLTFLSGALNLVANAWVLEIA